MLGAETQVGLFGTEPLTLAMETADRMLTSPKKVLFVQLPMETMETDLLQPQKVSKQLANDERQARFRHCRTCGYQKQKG